MTAEKSKLVIFQFPNWQLAVFFTAWIFSIYSSGLIKAFFLGVFFAVGFIWAYEEISRGDSIFRRVFGSFFALYLLYRLTLLLL